MTLAMTMTVIAVAFGISAIAGYGIIPALRRMRFGQSIREEGPKAHLKKLEHQQWVGLFF